MPKIHRDRPPTNATTDIVTLVPPRVELPDPPARSARKTEWVAYAKAIGVDSSGTKAQIIARVG